MNRKNLITIPLAAALSLSLTVGALADTTEDETGNACIQQEETLLESKHDAGNTGENESPEAGGEASDKTETYAPAELTGALANRADIVAAVEAEIPDTIISNAVLAQIDRNMGEDGDWQTTMKSITTLDLAYTDGMDHQIQDLTGIQLLEGLTSLNLSGHAIQDITPLSDARLSGLVTLNLADNDIQDIAPISANHGDALKVLDLSGNAIEETGPLSYVTGLTSLYLSENLIQDLGGVEGLTGLTALNVSYNAIEDLGSIEGLTALTFLDVSHNNIQDLGAVEALENLESLIISDNEIEDLSPLQGLTALKTLNVANNKIADFSFVPEGVEVTGRGEQTVVEPSEPDDPDEPSSPDEPGEPDEPENPGETDDPENPGETDEPGNTDQPESTDEPESTGEPESTDEPQTTEEPKQTADPGSETPANNATVTSSGSTVPETGDNSKPALWLSLFGIGGAGLGGISIFRRKKFN